MLFEEIRNAEIKIANLKSKFSFFIFNLPYSWFINFGLYLRKIFN
jgi:hypothetical protein